MSAHDLECPSGWSKDVVLFHLPPERELLVDAARRLAFEAYLNVSKLPYTKRQLLNADYVSPSGTSPFLHVKSPCSSLIVWDFDQLHDILVSLKLGSCTELGQKEKADREAYISVVRIKIAVAEVYETWAHSQNVVGHTLAFQGKGLAWPLNHVVPWINWIKFCWNHWELWKTPRPSVLLECEHGCQVLSQRLGDKERFFEAGVTTLDILAFAHLQAILTTALPGSELTHIVSRFDNLVRFCNDFKLVFMVET